MNGKKRHIAALLTVWTVGLTGSHFCIAAPTIFWTSDPVEANETALVSGAKFSNVRSVRIDRLQDDPDRPAPTEEPLTEAKILQQSDHAVKFLIPSSLGPGVYRFNFAYDGVILRGMLNAPSIYWTQGDAGEVSTPGGWLRIFGRDIARRGGAMLELIDGNGRTRRLQTVETSLWDARFAVPEGLAAGRYRLRLWNGQGDASAWRDAGEMVICDAIDAPVRIVNVKEQGAAGDGEHDDAPALANALKQLGEAGGGVLFLPRGRYRLAKPLSIPDGVTLRGDGRDLTSLVWSDMEEPPPALLEGGADFGVEDVSIVARRHLDILRGGFGGHAGGREQSRIVIRRVRIRATAYRGHISPGTAAKVTEGLATRVKDGPASLRLGGRNLVVEDCDVYGSARAFVLERPVRARISGNVFYNGRKGWYSISGADGVIFENNLIFGADLESTGGGINTLGPGVNASQNVLFKNNRLERMFGWDREALTTDGPGGFYYGAVKFDGAGLVLLDPVAKEAEDHDWSQAGLFILGGDAIGFSARVRARRGMNVELDRDPPTLPADRRFVATIAPMQAHYLFIGNHFVDTGAAVQIFGVGYEHVIASNIAERTSGFINHALVYHHVQPSWYNQFLDNEIVSGPGDETPVLSMWGEQAGQSREIVNYGSIVRGNRLGDDAVITLRGGAKDHPALSDAIVERNVLGARARSIRVDEGVVDALIRENRQSHPR